MNETFEVPHEFATAIEKLDDEQVKRSVELMGQCVQVQGSVFLVFSLFCVCVCVACVVLESWFVWLGTGREHVPGFAFAATYY